MPPRTPLTPERLVADLGPRAPFTARSVHAHARLAGEDPAALAEWRRRLEQTHGERPLTRVHPEDLAALQDTYGVDDPERLLFAIHAHFAGVARQAIIRLGGVDDEPFAGAAGPAAELSALWSTYDLDAASGDLFKDLYQALIPGAVRHALGEFYTPVWLAEHTLDLAGYTGDPGARVLDASCGSGTFLVLAIQRALRRPARRAQTIAEILDDGIVGLDLNPLAVLAARANYLLALGPLRPAGPVRVPVYRVDAVLHADAVPRLRDRFDVVVGNPPHVSWRHLPADWRRRATPRFERYALFTLTGLAAVHGGSQKDIAALFIYTAVEVFLRRGGTLALVVHVSLFKTEGAGEGFRRFRLGVEGAPFRVEEAHDFSSFQPFQSAADRAIKTRTLSFRARSGEATTYPVPYHVWTKTRRGPLPGEWTWAEARRELRAEEHAARPLRGPLSPWICARPDAWTDIRRILAPHDYNPAYRAHVGAYTGGLNGCYWLEVLGRNDDGTLVVENCADIGKKSVRRVRATLEADLVYPLLRGRQAARWACAPAGHILMVQDPRRRAGYDEAWLRQRYPRTARFLEQFRGDLLARPVYRKFFAAASAPFYSMYGVREETFAPYKVVWMEISATVKASLLAPAAGERVVVPDHKVILVAVGSEQEGDYLTGVLNSPAVAAALRAYAVDNNVATNLLKNVVVPAFDPGDRTHLEISAAARRVRQAVAHGDADGQARGESALSAAVAPLWR